MSAVRYLANIFFLSVKRGVDIWSSFLCHFKGRADKKIVSQISVCNSTEEVKAESNCVEKKSKTTRRYKGTSL